MITLLTPVLCMLNIRSSLRKLMSFKYWIEDCVLSHPIVMFSFYFLNFFMGFLCSYVLQTLQLNPFHSVKIQIHGNTNQMLLPRALIRTFFINLVFSCISTQTYEIGQSSNAATSKTSVNYVVPSSILSNTVKRGASSSEPQVFWLFHSLFMEMHLYSFTVVVIACYAGNRSMLDVP